MLSTYENTQSLKSILTDMQKDMRKLSEINFKLIMFTPESNPSTETIASRIDEILDTDFDKRYLKSAINRMRKIVPAYYTYADIISELRMLTSCEFIRFHMSLELLVNYEHDMFMRSGYYSIQDVLNDYEYIAKLFPTYTEKLQTLDKK